MQITIEQKKQKALVSKLPRNKRKLSVSLFKTLLVIFLAIVVLGIGSGFGMLKGILDDTPEVNAKDLIPKGYQTTLYDQDGINFDASIAGGDEITLRALMPTVSMFTTMIYRKHL